MLLPPLQLLPLQFANLVWIIKLAKYAAQTANVRQEIVVQMCTISLPHMEFLGSMIHILNTVVFILIPQLMAPPTLQTLDL